MIWSQTFLQLEYFANFFGNIFNILMVIAFILIGAILGFVLSRYLLKPRNQVLYCRERDGRGEEYNIKNESAKTLETDTDPALRFFKFGRAYEFRRRGRAFTRFFAKEGTAYTWRLLGFQKVKSNPEGIEKLKEVSLEFPTLEEAIKHAWGKEDYDRTPEELQAKLRDKKMYVTVNLEEGITPEGYEPITEEIINKEGDQTMAALLAAEVKEASKLDWKMILIILVAGAGILAIASKALQWW